MPTPDAAPLREYRQDPLTGEWVIIATDRGRRPDEFTSATPRLPTADYVQDCPFCPGHEKETPAEVFAVRDDYATADREGWQVRVVPNKYAAVAIDADGVPTPEAVAFGADSTEPKAAPSDLHVAAPAVGMHEVVIESPSHARHFEALDASQAERVLRTLRHRCAMIVQARDVKHVVPFKNRGPSAGATIEHPHFQIIAPGVIPPSIKRLVNRQESYESERGRPLFAALLEEELEAGTRVIAANDEFVTLAPWASAWPYESWIIPREHTAFFHDTPEGHLGLLATSLQGILQRLDHLLAGPDFNLVIHTGPKWHKAERYHRWFIRIVPRVNRLAGFELATGMFINTVAPEAAAAALRERTGEETKP